MLNILKNNLGVMQGRLLPKYRGSYQAHPVDYWRDEFEIAKKFELDYIEFILDYEDAFYNPLLKNGGPEEILEICEKTGVSIKTICADYFMDAPLHSENKSVVSESLNILNKLLETSKKIGVTDIVIPCVDKSTLNSSEAVERFVSTIHSILPLIEKRKINLSLETDLPPQSFAKLIDRINCNRVTVNYDIGNSASLGYDSAEELDAYGDKISDIHIKDRLLGGTSVVLGKGNVDFEKFFSKIVEFDYQGPFIMQAFRDDEGVEIFRKQLDWLKNTFSIDR
jgi:L-ribulose-5-phosphate 3-epimerase